MQQMWFETAKYFKKHFSDFVTKAEPAECELAWCGVANPAHHNHTVMQVSTNESEVSAPID